MGRPRKYANNAEKVAAYRARYPVIDIRMKAETLETVDRLCEVMDLPRSEVLNQLISFALANRAWHTAPRFTSYLPRKENPLEPGD